MLEYMSESLPCPGGSSESGESGRPGPAPEVPLERLEAQICELAGHLTAATCRFLLLVGDFDARRGWESWDLPSCSAWLAWKCQLAPGTAREQVRVARALRELPVIRGEFAAGRMSYAKVRALTRIATAATEQDLAELAGPMTGGQLDRFARAHRQVSRADDQHARAARRVTWRIDDEDGSLAMTVRLPAVKGQVLVQALRAAAADLDHPHDAGHDGGASAEAPGPLPHAADEAGPPPGGPPADGPDAGSPQAASLADSLAGIAADYLAGKITAAGNPDLYQVIVHVGPEALADPESDPAAGAASAEAPAAGPATASPPPPAPGRSPAPGHDDTPGHHHDQPLTGASAEAPAAELGGGACRADCPYRQVGHLAHPRRCHLEDGQAISPAAAQRIACAATVSWMLHDHDGTLLDIGRRHRRPTAAIRRAVRERDRYRCRFPGCHSRRTDLHHIRHWARGGKTSCRNLILLCEAHHVIVHELGYLITADDGGGFTFTRPDGNPLPPSPALPAPAGGGDITAVHDAHITPQTINAPGDRLDLHLAIWSAFASARIKRERAERERTTCA